MSPILVVSGDVLTVQSEILKPLRNHLRGNRLKLIFNTLNPIITVLVFFNQQQILHQFQIVRR